MRGESVASPGLLLLSEQTDSEEETERRHLPVRRTPPHGRHSRWDLRDTQPQCHHTRQNRHNTGHTNPPQPGSHASLQSPQSCTASNIAAHYTVTTNSPHSASLSTADIYRSILKPVSSFTPSGPFPVTLTIHFCSFSVWNPNSPVRIIVNLLIYSFLVLSLLGLTTLNLSHFKFYLLSFLSFPD